MGCLQSRPKDEEAVPRECNHEHVDCCQIPEELVSGASYTRNADTPGAEALPVSARDTKNLHHQYTNQNMGKNMLSAGGLTIQEYSLEALAGGALDLAVITGKDRKWIFPRWGSHRKCSYCMVCGAKSGGTVHGDGRLRKQNNQKISELQDGSNTKLANMLAMNALDLTAPASDALLKNRKNAWVQLAGHPGSFAPAGPNTIWKKRLSKENAETVAYQLLMKDSVHDIVPAFYREVEYNGDFFIEMEDLLQHFQDPHIMDIKMGTSDEITFAYFDQNAVVRGDSFTGILVNCWDDSCNWSMAEEFGTVASSSVVGRTFSWPGTFLESEVKNPVVRKDLYEKMIKLAPDEPSEAEHEEKAITKLRYMQFREQGSSTATLGFRVEAIRLSGEPPDTQLKKVKTTEQVMEMFSKFLKGNMVVRKGILQRLREMRAKFEVSAFFRTHEIIGSSLLILYDREDKVGVWMIDFAKTMQVEDGLTLTHRAEWKVGNHEDGYLIGLDNLIEIVEDPSLDSMTQDADAKEKSSSMNSIHLEVNNTDAKLQT